MFASRNSLRMLWAFLGILAIAPYGWTAGAIVENVSSPFGKFNGVDYLRHVGRLVGTTSNGNYRVPYEIVAPADPAKGNGRILVEPSHWWQKLVARDALLGHDALFERGFTHAGVGWSLYLNSILDPQASDVYIDAAGGADIEIIVHFANALVEDSAGHAIVGDVQKLYSIGYSQTSFTLHSILHSPLGQGLFDLTLLSAPPIGEAGHVPATGAGRIIVFATEADIILFGAAALRAADYSFPHYRMYEVAGAPHIPDTEGTRPYFPGPFPPPIEGTTPLDWTPSLHALFVAGDRWVTTGLQPPPSTFLEDDFPGVPDPVYGFPTGIARDENLNAKGGIRMPDLELGRGQFIAVDFAYFFYFGDFVDLRCELLPDGSERFPNHGLYLSDFAPATQELVSGTFLLPEDAVVLMSEAGQCDVGKPGSCP